MLINAASFKLINMKYCFFQGLPILLKKNRCFQWGE